MTFDPFCIIVDATEALRNALYKCSTYLLHRPLLVEVSFSYFSYYTVSRKKFTHFIFVITRSNIDR